MVVLEILGVYLALAALFYLGLTAMAVDVSIPARNARHKWQRARRMKESALRRLHSLSALRPPRRTR